MGNWIFLDDLAIDLNEVKAIKYLDNYIRFYLKSGESINTELSNILQTRKLKDIVKEALTEDMPIPEQIQQFEGLIKDFKNISDTLGKQ